MDATTIAMDALVALVVSALGAFVISRLRDVITKVEFETRYKHLEDKVDKLQKTLDTITVLKVKGVD